MGVVDVDSETTNWIPSSASWHAVGRFGVLIWRGAASVGGHLPMLLGEVGGSRRWPCPLNDEARGCLS